jgi:hypothetical protein
VNPAWADLAAEIRIIGAFTITGAVAALLTVTGLLAAVHAIVRAEAAPARPADDHGGDDGTQT